MVSTPPSDDLAARMMGLWSWRRPPSWWTGPGPCSAATALRHHLLDRVDTPDRLVIAFRLQGTHTGPLATPLGTVAATGATWTSG